MQHLRSPEGGFRGSPQLSLYVWGTARMAVQLEPYEWEEVQVRE